MTTLLGMNHEDLSWSIPNREAATITKAWVKNYERLARVAAAPKHNILGNEFSVELKKARQKQCHIRESTPQHTSTQCSQTSSLYI